MRNWLIVVLLLIPVTGFSQFTNFHKEKVYRTFLRSSASMVYLVNARSPGQSLNVNVLARQNWSENIRLGLGYDVLAYKYWLNGVHFLVDYRINDLVVVNGAAGAAFGRFSGSERVTPSVKLNIFLDFEVANLRMGPIIGVGNINNKGYISGGLQVGFDFNPIKNPKPIACEKPFYHMPGKLLSSTGECW